MKDSFPLRFRSGNRSGRPSGVGSRTFRRGIRPSPPTKWDPAFEDVFCCLLAGEAIAAITGEVNAVEMMEQRAELGLQRARRIGAISPAGEIPLQVHPWDEYSRNF